MKLCIVEGVDLVGKSTAIETLKEKFSKEENIQFLYWGKLTETEGSAADHWLDRIQTALQKMRMQTNPDKPIIAFCDRSFLGNLIYGDHFKDQLPLSYSDALNLVNRLGKTCEQLSINLLRCSSGEFMKRYKERAEDYVEMGDLFTLQEAYEDLFGKLIKDADPKIIIKVLPPDADPETIINLLLNNIGYEIS